MEIRELRCFVAVADTLHFGRAAERLGMAQPPLSRTIARFERGLGTPLFERSSRRVSLTDAGRALLPDARAIIGATGVAERRVRQAASGGPRLAVAAKAGGSNRVLMGLLAAYAATEGAVPVEVELCDIGEVRHRLLDGGADVAVLHLPYESTEGLDFDVLDVEGQMMVVPVDHPLAARSRIALADLADLADPPPARWPNEDGTFPSGRGAEVHSLTQLVQLIGLGRVVAQLPASVCDELPSDVAAVPVIDAAQVTTVIAWAEYSRSQLTADFVRAVTADAESEALR